MIAYGVGKTNGAFVGGHVNNLINLSKTLVAKDHEVDVVTVPPVQSSDRDMSVTEYDGVTVHTVSIPDTLSAMSASEEGNISLKRGALGLPRLVAKVRELDRIRNYDVVHGHSGYPWVGLIPELSQLTTSARTVHTLYCPIADRGVSYRFAAAASIGFCDHVVGISENVSASVPRVPAINLSTIPPLVDRERFINRNTQGCNDEFELLFLGNLSESKGIRTLIRALSVVDETLDVRLYLALDMSVEEYHRTNSDVKDIISKAGLEESIEPVGIVEDLPSLMNRCDAFVAPFNDTQGPADYPLAMLEAMSCGLPIIASRVGGIPEVVTHGESGILITPKAYEALAEQILRLADDESLRAQLSEAGEEVVRSIYSEVTTQYLRIYRDIRKEK